MPSPFPGMNPYLEQEDVWHDFHERFIPLIATVVGSQLRPRYIVKIDEHIYVHELAGESRQLAGRADISLGRSSPRIASESSLESATSLLEAPASVRLPAIDLERRSLVEIRDRRDRALIAVIELLIPSNKYLGPDREHYLAKRMEILNGPAHLVEIDLLRAGSPLPAAGRPECSYSILVSRAESRPEAAFWPVMLRQPLPLIPVPVRAPHDEARLDLQTLLDRIYDDAGYADYIYDGNPHPRLEGDDAVWAREFLPDSAP